MRIKLISPDERWETTVTSGSTFAIQKVNLPLLAALTPSWHTVTIVDECFAPDDPEDVPDLAGITVMTELAARAYRIADSYRARGARVVLGGIHPTVRPKEALEHADAIVIGEGEECWPRLVGDAAAGALRRVYQAHAPADLSRAAIPDRSAYPKRDRFSYAPAGVGLETARGCPYDCSFCSVSRIAGKKLRFRPVEQIIAEIEGIDSANLFLVDDSIGLDRRRAFGLFEAMRPLRRRWVGQGNVSLAEDPTLLRAMRRSGCLGLLVGFESLDPAIGAGMTKLHRLSIDYGEAMRRFHDEGIAILGAFVFGLDGESPEVFDATLEFALRHRLDGVQLRVVTPFPGTRLFDDLDREGRLFDREWWLRGYPPGTLLYRPRGMTPEQLVGGTRRVSRECYSLSGILHRLFGIRPWARTAAGLALVAGYNLGTRMRYFKALAMPQPAAS